MTKAPTNATTAEDATLLVHAHLDGELDLANALAVERRIAGDPILAAESVRIAALQNALREKFPRESLPPNLRRRVEAAVGLHRARSRPSWRALAASVALAMVVASGSTWLALRPALDDRVAEQVVGDHMRALMAPQPIDVASSDRHTVKPWFSSRIPQSPLVVDLAPEGFALVGGRIDVVGGAPVPALVYRTGRHLISVLALPAPSRVSDATVRRAINGYNVVGWTQDGVRYWAVSDLAIGDLEKFAKLFRAAPIDR
jgi:anti-sigma factor RsiW